MHPKYYLPEVPQDLRRQALDLCYARRWYDARDFLHDKGFTHYTVDDLNNFYNWAPTTHAPPPAPTPLPNSEPRTPSFEHPRDHQPSAPFRNREPRTANREPSPVSPPARPCPS